MTTRLSLLFASTALTVALGLPAVAALQTPGSATDLCSGVCAAVFGDAEPSLPLIRISGEEDDDDEDAARTRRGDDDDDDDDCEGDDGNACTGVGARSNPAPAGTVAPPSNGLFGSGAPPVAVTN